MLSETALSMVVAVLGVVATGVIGIVAYVWQERQKRETALAERRRLLYESLVRNLVELLAAETGAERSKLISEIEKGWLFASDEVLHALYEYLNTYDFCWTRDRGVVLAKVREDPRIREEFANSLAAVFLAMRRDLRSTKISDDWANRQLRIYEWGIIARSDQTYAQHRTSWYKWLMSKLLRE